MRARTLGILASLAVLVVAGALVPHGGQASTAPLLSARGEKLKWTAADRNGTYKVMARSPGGRTISTVVGKTTVTPVAVPGETVTYQVKTAFSKGAWSNPVSISYPEEELIPEPRPVGEEMIVGLNAGGWGPTAWADVSGAAKAVRLESRFATDAEVGAAADAGVTVASWLFGTGGTIGAIDPTAFAAEIVATFKRYGKGGTFWQGRTDLGGQAVEVLNEPDGNWFWTDPTNYAAYTRLLKAVHEALAANFPEAIRPKVLATWGGHRIPFGVEWKALGGLAYCDGVVVHPYGGANGETGGALGDRQAVAEAHHLSGKPIYVTEVGWPTAFGKQSTGDSQQWTEAQQAENITAFIQWARGTHFVAMVDIFGYVDYGTNTWYGVERQDRSHKPSFAALASA